MIDDKNDTLFKLKVDTVLSITSSLASVIKGNIAEIKPGFQFRITNWVSSGRPLLKVYIPNSQMTEADVLKFISAVEELKHSPKIKWLDNIGKGTEEPYTTVFWQDDKCFIKVGKDASKEIININAQNILQYCKKDSTLYVELPVSKEK